MTKTRTLLLWLFLTVVFTLLFYRQFVGLNLLVYELIVLFILRQKFGYFFRPVYAKVLVFSLLATLSAVVLVNSILAIVVNLVFLLLLVAYLSQGQEANMFGAALAVARNGIMAPFSGIKAIGNEMYSNKTGKGLQLIYFLIVLIVGVLVLLLFALIYSSASPWFESFSGSFIQLISDWLELYDPEWIPLTVLGFLLGAYVLFSSQESWITQINESPENITFTNRQPGGAILNGVKLVLLLLNVLLAVVNWLDLKNVWLFFEWNGGFLKQFVHEGTFLLLFSVALASLVLLGIYSENSRSLQRNRSIKYLATAWIIQNAFLVLSVGMRNYWYMSYFALAYKRIAVVFVLILILVGLVLLYQKIHKARSVFWLIRQSSLAFFVVLALAALPDWDSLIARYNLKNYEHSFVHFDFLIDLPDRTLDDMDISRDELEKIDAAQKRLFFLEGEYMQGNEFYEQLQKRKEKFHRRQENKSILSWNLADHMAARRLQADASK
ncbi:MAG: hypothetical protein PWQ54_2200 [Bacteroidales bacterium]|jgi:hypothetical protein|nr:hypothetical protein [Bacteroidales bacterium]